jgi:hypothetical protein
LTKDKEIQDSSSGRTIEIIAVRSGKGGLSPKGQGIASAKTNAISG